MIPILLWRCPQCHRNDALIEEKKFLRPWLVKCTNCHTIWKSKRIMGEDFQLTVITCPTDKSKEGIVHPLAELYADMKSTMGLEPIDDPAISLQESEQLFLSSKQVELMAIANDPVFFPGYIENPDGEPPVAEVVGKGRTFLTNQRFIWMDDEGKQQDFPLNRVNSTYTIFNMGIVLMHETSLYVFRYEEESLLMWVTYFALVAPLVKEATGHTITTSNY